MTVIQNNKSVVTTPALAEPNKEINFDTLNSSELLSAIKKMQSEEFELNQLKQDLLKQEQELRTQLLKEFEKEKATIKKLKSEISGLLDTVNEIKQSL